jgi:preprotein translocase subunit SecA
MVSLTTLDDLWAEHLAAVTALREGIQWVSWGGREPLHEYLKAVHTRFEELDCKIDAEIARRMAESETNRIDPSQRGATWTYLTTDQPFGSASERIIRGLLRRAGRR